MVRAELGRLSWSAIQPGHRVAITAGSRGIGDIADILAVIVEFSKSLGADPFFIPAIGSHGGATAAGQVAVLEQWDVTETSLNAKDLPAPPDSKKTFLRHNGLRRSRAIKVRIF